MDGIRPILESGYRGSMENGDCGHITAFARVNITGEFFGLAMHRMVDGGLRWFNSMALLSNDLCGWTMLTKVSLQLEGMDHEPTNTSDLSSQDTR
jgi:hypothetical protein